MLDRRSFLTCAASNLLVPSLARADNAPATLILGDDGPGQPIAPDFMGLSYESALLAAPDYFSPDNVSLIALLKALGDRGLLRLGGNSSERTIWSPNAVSNGAGRYVIAPDVIDRLSGFLDRLGWRAIYGLNLADNTPERAAEEAEYVAKTLGPRLFAIQIGNEPDGFGRWSRVRPASYDVHSFLAEWQRFHAAIHARVPEARFAGPDVAAETAWIAPFADARPANVVLLTRHYYAAGPASDPSVTLAKLLHSQTQLAAVLSDLRELSSTYRLPFRIAETNSVFAGGRPGVSDTMGAALWGLELMFQVATAGGSGVNFHAGPDKVYTPIGEPGPPHRPQPLYYGLLLFARMAAGEIIPSRIESPVEISAFATRASAGTVRICLINKDAAAARVRILSRRRFAAGVEHLSASSLDARSGLTLTGAAVDSDGPERPNRAHDEFQLDLAAGSAALVRMEPR